MKEIIHAIGTLITIVVLVITVFTTQSTLVQILTGISLGYIMIFHDEYLKCLWKDESKKEFEAGVKQAEKDVLCD